jgi:hypothetical protein
VPRPGDLTSTPGQPPPADAQPASEEHDSEEQQ